MFNRLLTERNIKLFIFISTIDFAYSYIWYSVLYEIFITILFTTQPGKAEEEKLQTLVIVFFILFVMFFLLQILLQVTRLVMIDKTQISFLNVWKESYRILRHNVCMYYCLHVIFWSSAGFIVGLSGGIGLFIVYPFYYCLICNAYLRMVKDTESRPNPRVSEQELNEEI